MNETRDAFQTSTRPPAQLAGSMTIPHAALRRFGISAALFLAHWVSCEVAGAQTTKTFIDYFQPTPITCSPLSSATWGVAAVLPHQVLRARTERKRQPLTPARPPTPMPRAIPAAVVAVLPAILVRPHSRSLEFSAS